VNFNCV